MKKVPAGHTALYSLRFFLFVVSDNFGEIKVHTNLSFCPSSSPIRSSSTRCGGGAPSQSPAPRQGRRRGRRRSSPPSLLRLPLPTGSGAGILLPPPVSTHTYAHTPFSHSPLPTPSLTSLPSLREPASTAAAEQQSLAVTAFCPLALTDTILCCNFLAN